MIKTVVFDMDGTLLNDVNVILPKTKEILMKAQRAGVRIILASGRPIGRMINYATELEMSKYGGYLVFVNGTGVYNVETGEEERFFEMAPEQQVEIYHYFKQFPLEILSLRDDGAVSYMSRELFLSKVEEAKRLGLDESVPLITDGEARIGDMKGKGYINLHYAHDHDSFILSANKMAVYGDAEVVAEATEKAKIEFADKYWVGRTMPQWGEIVLPEVNKAKALEKLFAELNIDPSTAIAFGDGENDIDMLRYCGVGVAMKNALTPVKEAADRIGLTNNEEGIAQILEELLEL